MRVAHVTAHVHATDVQVESMVVPLLQTLWRCANSSTVCWLCGQVRCPDAHAALMREAPSWFGDVQLLPLDDFPFAAELECFLLQLQAPTKAAGEEKGELGNAPGRLAADRSDIAADGTAAASGSGSERKRGRTAEGRKAEQARGSGAAWTEAAGKGAARTAPAGKAAASGKVAKAAAVKMAARRLSQRAVCQTMGKWAALTGALRESESRKRPCNEG